MSKQEYPDLTSVRSTGSRLEVADHEIDLNAVTSNPVSIGDVGVSLTADQKYVILNRLNYDGLVSLEDLPTGALFMIEKIEGLQVQEGVEILRQAMIDHANDVNYPTKDLDFITKLVEEAPADGYTSPDVKSKLDGHFADKENSFDEKKGDVNATTYAEPSSSHSDNYYEIFDWPFQVKLEAALLAYHSPYPEVRAVTDPFDDPSLPCETLRAYIVGFIWNAIGTFINQFFAQRQPAISFTTAVAQLFLYPSGLLTQYIFPEYSFKLFGLTIDLNPGPWSYKEQMFSTIVFSVAGGGTSYVQYNIFTQKSEQFYGNEWASWGYQILLILSTNFLGFGFAGVLRRFAVYPINAIWPSILPTVALNRALLKPERNENINGWTISRYYFFFIATTASFVWNWVPEYLFAALSSFNWMTWIAPENKNLAYITGTFGGLGVNPVTSFDWNIIDYSGSTLSAPFYSTFNQYIGSVIAFFCIVGVYWSNYKWTAYLPLNSNGIFTNTGDSYAVTAVLDKNGKLDQAKYDIIGPPFYTAANLVVYGAFFAIYPFAIIYEGMTNWRGYYSSLYGAYKSIRNWKTSTSIYDGHNDPHCRMMSRFKEVPDWCYLVVLVIALVLGIIMVEIYPTETPVWTLFFALAINFVFLIPLTMIYSTTSFSFGLNVLVELIIGYALPGNSQALMIVKAFGYNIDGQAQNYISDQKMAHYAKIPPRAIFRGQLMAVLMSSFIGLGVVNWQLDSVEGICTRTQKSKFTCPGARTFYSASVLWGTIGPKKVFGGLYPVLQYCFLIGALLAPVCWALKFYFPRKLKFFQPTLIIGGFLIYAPYNLSYYTAGLYVSFAFMSYIRVKYQTWWEKYTYVLAGALSSGVAFSAVIIFFAVQYKEKDVNWWGNTVPYAGVDYSEPARLNVTISEPDGYFGPRIGSYP
ncbi:oligopeptide transporter 2 [[Candida] anglica]